MTCRHERVTAWWQGKKGAELGMEPPPRPAGRAALWARSSLHPGRPRGASGGRRVRADLWTPTPTETFLGWCLDQGEGNQP